MILYQFCSYLVYNYLLFRKQFNKSVTRHTFKNNVAIGIISISISIVSLVRIFTAALDNIVKPIFAKLQREQNTKELIQVYHFDTRMNSY